MYAVFVFNLENFTPDRIFLHGHHGGGWEGAISFTSPLLVSGDEIFSSQIPNTLFEFPKTPQNNTSVPKTKCSISF